MSRSYQPLSGYIGAWTETPELAGVSLSMDSIETYVEDIGKLISKNISEGLEPIVSDLEVLQKYIVDSVDSQLLQMETQLTEWHTQIQNDMLARFAPVYASVNEIIATLMQHGYEPLGSPLFHPEISPIELPPELLPSPIPSQTSLEVASPLPPGFPLAPPIQEQPLQQSTPFALAQNISPQLNEVLTNSGLSTDSINPTYVPLWIIVGSDNSSSNAPRIMPSVTMPLLSNGKAYGPIFALSQADEMLRYLLKHIGENPPSVTVDSSNPPNCCQLFVTVNIPNASISPSGNLGIGPISGFAQPNLPSMGPSLQDIAEALVDTTEYIQWVDTEKGQSVILDAFAQIGITREDIENAYAELGDYKQLADFDIQSDPIPTEE